jgi:hypothetical protein
MRSIAFGERRSNFPERCLGPATRINGG